MNRYTYTQESVKKAIDYLKTLKGQPPNFIRDHPDSFTTRAGQLYYEKKMVVPEELRDELLRKILYTSPGGPMGRDSLYFFIQPNFLGISRSEVLEFLKKQKVLQDVKPMPASEINKRGRIYHKKLGVLETDLIHLTARDAPFWLKVGSKDRFFVVVCCVMTGFTQVRLSNSKEPLEMIKHFKKLFPIFEKYFPITLLRSDKGGEFKNNAMASWLKEQNIKQKFVPLASMVENRNRLFQRAFFTTARSKKGKLFQAIKSATETVNNTLNRRIGLTPQQAIQKSSAELRQLRSQKRKTQPGTKKGPIKFKPGSLVRVLKIARKDKGKGYKSYKAESWSPDLYTVTASSRQGSAYKYKLNSGSWKWADELLGVSSPDKVSSSLQESRSFVQEDKVYFDKDDDEYEPPLKVKKPKKPIKKPLKVLKVTKVKKVKPIKKVKPLGRRSSRLRGKRVDYHKIQHRYDKVLD